jgi:hypothetical protein
MNSNTRARAFIVAVALAALLCPSDSTAQVGLEPVLEFSDTAENAPWYVGGEPITFAGNIYYPAGPRVFFNRYEMIRSGFYEGVPLYTRTTIEPFSVVFVPVGGGVMHPYERRRAGDIAGTAGSTTPAFPIVTAAEQGADRYQGVLPQAAAPPTRMAISIGDTSRELTDVTPGTSQRFAAARMSPPPVPTAGSEAEVPVAVAPLTPAGPMRTALRPIGLNGVFIDFDSRRWFSSGPAVEFSSSRFTKIGEHHGFPVYATATGGSANTIYVALTVRGGDLVSPYSLRR